MKKKYYARRRRSRRKASIRFYVIIGLLIIALAVGIYLIVKAVGSEPGTPIPPSETVDMTAPEGTVGLPIESTEPTPTPQPSLSDDLVPHATENTDPAKFGFETAIQDNGTDVTTYQRSEPISFGSGDEYTALEGIIGFRGNNYRDVSSWGTATISEEKLEKKDYNKQTSAIGNWGGAAWTGQPLIVKWPAETRAKMTSLYEEFRNKEDFVEVIYASLDGRLYFMELSTGTKTRDFIDIGAPTKGTPALDPRGYPIIYVGQGLQSDGSGTSCNNMFVRAYSLIDNSLLMKFGAESKDPFALRSWQAYDSSPLVDAKTDTLIYLGENGIMYTCKLNTQYDPSAGTLTMDADPAKVKYRYTTPRNRSADASVGGRWGMENSPAAWREYIFFTDNAGMLQCVNLNTMELVYANDLDDDSDVSLVLEEDVTNNAFYLYTGCEYDELVRDLGSSGPAYARKIDGLTGEVLWTKDFMVQSNSSVDGGILATPVLGKEGTTLEGLIIYNVTAEIKGDSTTSKLYALNKDTGDIVWEYDMDVSGWSPSSPVTVYSDKTNAEGKTIGYIVQCDKAGDVALLKVDGGTCTEVDKLSLANGEVDHNFEATPAVYGNTIVVASRDREIFFIEVK